MSFNTANRLELQQQRWEAGESPTVEELLVSTRTAPQPSREETLDLIYGEILLREARGEEVPEAEYLARFPDLADELILQFEVHRGLKSGLVSGPSSSGHGKGGDPGIPRFPLKLTSTCEVTRFIGEGGAARVWQGRDRTTGRSVAVKILRNAGPDASSRLMHEARLLATLNHPNIVTLFSAGESGGVAWMIQEFVAGNSLRHRSGSRALPARGVCLFMIQVLDGLEHAHRHGIVHCDLSPGNILIPETDAGLPGDDSWLETAVPRLADFGLARWADVEKSRSGRIEGTLMYMAPEQAAGTRTALTPATDIHAVAAIIYELLTGRPPCVAGSVAEMLEQLLHREPLPLRKLRPQIERDLETIVQKGLEKDPARRYQSAAGMRADLKAFLEHRPISARPAGWFGRVVRWSRRNVALSAALAAAVVFLVGGLVASGYSASIAWENLRIADSESERAGREREAAIRERDLARKATDKARKEAADAERMANALYEMLGAANPAAGGQPVLLADWLMHGLGASDTLAQLAPGYEGKLRMQLAIALVNLGHQKEAVPHLRRAAALLGEFPEFHGLAIRHLAMVLASANAGWTEQEHRVQIIEARQLLGEIVESAGFSSAMRIAAQIQLAQVELIADNLADAEKTIREALEKASSPQQPDPVLQREANRFLAAILTRTGRSEQAIPVLRKIMDASNGDQNGETTVETRIELARALAATGLEHYPESISICRSLLPGLVSRYRSPLNPVVRRVAVLLASNRVRLGGNPQALIDELEPVFEEVEFRTGDDVTVCEILAAIRLSKVQLGEAEKHASPCRELLDAGLQQDPERSLLLYMKILLAKELAMQGKPEEGLVLASEVAATVLNDAVPPHLTYLRIPLLQVQFGTHTILGNSEEANRIRELLPPEKVPQIPAHLLKTEKRCP